MGVEDHVCTWSNSPTSLDHDKASASLPLSNTRSMPRALNTLASTPSNYTLNTLGGHPWSDLGGSEDMYLDAVKMQFRDKPEVYCQFSDTMQDFRHLMSVVWSLIYYLLNALRIPYHRIDCSGVIKRLGALFYGKPFPVWRLQYVSSSWLLHRYLDRPEEPQPDYGHYTGGHKDSEWNATWIVPRIIGSWNYK